MCVNWRRGERIKNNTREREEGKREEINKREEKCVFRESCW